MSSLRAALEEQEALLIKEAQLESDAREKQELGWAGPDIGEVFSLQRTKIISLS